MSLHFIQEPLEKTAATLAPTQAVTLNVNGKDQTIQIAPWTTLLDALREYLDMTGTKKGCDHGQCGACTVLVDGKRINSCLSLATVCQSKQITTIEGIGSEENLSPLQQAFVDHDAFQCGYQATAADEAVRDLTSHDGAAYLGGGTNLVDLMKYNLERPTHLTSLGLLPLTDISGLPDGGLRLGALATVCQSKQITTIEGIGSEENLSPLQQAFVDHDAFQCGY
ncbi:MAG: 2Fe-2S iron-sulfur cluster binding domain-containing protein, partial [Hymenobacter sp.]